MTVDYRMAVDFAVLMFTAYTSWNNAKMRIQIDGLKLWMIQNFQPRPNANFLTGFPTE